MLSQVLGNRSPALRCKCERSRWRLAEILCRPDCLIPVRPLQSMGATKARLAQNCGFSCMQNKFVTMATNVSITRRVQDVLLIRQTMKGRSGRC